MTKLGYEDSLYILAFDHRGSFQKKMFGIEGDPTPEQTETIADAKRTTSTEKVEQWLQQAAPVDGFVGFSIWWDALKGYLSNELERVAAAEQIAENYLNFIHVYRGQPVSSPR